MSDVRLKLSEGDVADVVRLCRLASQPAWGMSTAENEAYARIAGKLETALEGSNDSTPNVVIHGQLEFA